ncbi:MAG: NAD-dependent deacylase [Planctomycetota bacterium]|nr:NAD-dependent deacylase [Planctomycetota bacterium]
MQALALDDYRAIVFFTGAGLSAEAGIPTYRGAGGVWASYDYETYACQEAFETDPDRVWDFHDERRKRMAAAAPGGGHLVVAAVQKAHAATCVITQNIDGLHQRAGAEDVVELHGSIWRVRCRCAPRVRPDFSVPASERRCGTCGVWRRPDITWFGDALPAAAVQRAMESLATCDLLISIGTSGVVYPAAELPRLATQRGARAIEINPQATPVSHLYDTVLRAPAAEALARIFPQLSAPPVAEA